MSFDVAADAYGRFMGRYSAPLAAEFVSALRGSLPGVDARQGAAESLPYPDDGFDLALAQLVVHFMTEPVAGARCRELLPDGAIRIDAAAWVALAPA